MKGWLAISTSPTALTRFSSGGETSMDHPAHIDGTTNCDDQHASRKDEKCSFHLVYSGAPPLLGKLIVVVEEPLDIGVWRPPLSV